MLRMKTTIEIAMSMDYTHKFGNLRVLGSWSERQTNFCTLNSAEFHQYTCDFLRPCDIPMLYYPHVWDMTDSKNIPVSQSVNLGASPHNCIPQPNLKIELNPEKARIGFKGLEVKIPSKYHDLYVPLERTSSLSPLAPGVKLIWANKYGVILRSFGALQLSIPRDQYYHTEKVNGYFFDVVLDKRHTDTLRAINLFTGIELKTQRLPALSKTAI